MKYYAFIRGINVGGNTKVDMTLLKKEVARKYSIQIDSYLNSGNLIIESSIDKNRVVEIIKENIRELFSVETEVIIKIRQELEEALENNPFRHTEGIDPSHLTICFLSNPVGSDVIQKIKANDRIIEPLGVKDDILYIHYVNGIARSKLTTGYIDRVLGLSSTGRNMNTIEGLLKK